MDESYKVDCTKCHRSYYDNVTCPTCELCDICAVEYYEQKNWSKFCDSCQDEYVGVSVVGVSV